MPIDTFNFDELNAFRAKVDTYKEKIIARYNNGEFTEDQYAGHLSDIDVCMKMSDKRFNELKDESDLNALENQSPEC